MRGWRAGTAIPPRVHLRVGTMKSTKYTKGIIIEPLMDTNGHESREEGEEGRGERGVRGWRACTAIPPRVHWRGENHDILLFSCISCFSWFKIFISVH